MAKYTYKTYNIAGFHLPEGMYSIAELEQMLADFKEAKQKDMLADDLRKQLAQPDEWQGLSPFDKTLLRTTHAPIKPVYYDKENDHSVCAEVVNDWDKFFTEIENKLRERNT
jgi:hypothetical protein